MIFNEIEINKNKLNIKEYSVSQTSLEQIFMYFARNQEKEDNEKNSLLIKNNKPTKRKNNKKNNNRQYQQLVE